MDAIPAWIDREAWEGFQEMRRKIKKPMTDRAIKMLLKRLDEMHRKGHDVNACIDQSTFCAWQDVYPLQDKSVPTIRDEQDQTQRLLAEQAAHRGAPPSPEQRQRLAQAVGSIVRRVA